MIDKIMAALVFFFMAGCAVLSYFRGGNVGYQLIFVANAVVFPIIIIWAARVQAR